MSKRTNAVACYEAEVSPSNARSMYELRLLSKLVTCSSITNNIKILSLLFVGYINYNR